MVVEITNNQEKEYALRYPELIALCVDQIQKLKARISYLEMRLGVDNED